MFKSLRFNLTGKFLILSITAYLCLSIISAYFFHHGLSQSLDEQLQEIYSVLLPSVEVGPDDSLSLRQPPKELSISNLILSPTVTLFGADRRLIVQHGPLGSKALMKIGTSEVPFSAVHLRTLAEEITNKSGKKVGFIQIQLSTAHREHAIAEFLEAIYATAPILLVALATAGYIFASRALRPLEDTFAILRRFMSDAGHELKTPIAVIHATCDNLLADLEGNKAATDRVEVISRTADRMQRLVADLLLLTKSEQSSLALKLVPLRFDMLLREVLGEFGDLYEDKGIELKADEITPTRVSGDKDALYRMLANLFENALNYTNSGGTVTVTLNISGSNLVLKVSDTGVGIPAEALDKIFERFFRVDESRSRAKGGAGLGLAIVKAIAESHHGSIAVASELGKGTTFTVAIPTVGQSTFFGRKVELDSAEKK